MLHRFRQSSRLASLLVLALVAGPAASALCPHPGEMHEEAAHEEAPMERTGMGHGAMSQVMGGHHEEAPPCHEEAPQPEPAETTDCLSPCCTVAPEAPAPVPPASLSAVAAVPVTVAIAEAEPREARALRPDPEPPPGPPLRVHLLLERFLT